MGELLGTPGSPKSLPLILARELASNLATPMFLLDAGGMLVFYNDAAALLLGKPFAELGEIPSGEFGAVAGARDPRRRADSPARLAVGGRVLRATARAHDGDGHDVRRRARARTKRPRTRCSARRARCTVWSRCSGSPSTGNTRLMQARVWGCRGSVAAPGPDTVKYGGNTSCVEVRLDERARDRARRRHRHAPARRRDAATTSPSSCTSCSRTCTWTICRASASSGRCSRPGSTSTSGARRHRCSTWPNASRCTCRRRCSRCGSKTCLRTSRSTTRPKRR